MGYASIWTGKGHYFCQDFPRLGMFKPVGSTCNVISSVIAIMVPYHFFVVLTLEGVI